MARTSTGVSFILKRPKAEISPIKAIFCYANAQLYYYEKKLSIPTEYWNKTSQRSRVTRSYPDHTQLNITLNAIESAIIDCYRNYKNEHNQEPTTEELRELVKIKRGTLIKEIVRPLEFFDFIEAFIRDAREGRYMNLSKGTQIAKVTIRTYEQTQKLLYSYSKVYGKLKYDDITTHFHRKFNHYLSQEYKSEETNEHLKINTIGKHITNIKTFMNEAVERNLTNNIAFRNKSFKAFREDVDKIYLSEREIKELIDLDLSDNSKLEKVRDLFVIGCYTALRISDLKRLSKQHVVEIDGDLYIIIEMKKTKKSVTIPIFPELENYLKKFETDKGYTFPKAISDQKANEYIKEVASKIDTLKEEVIINTTENGLRVSKSIPKYQLISNHTARRSFATNAVLRKIPRHIIMAITGHSTEKSFNRYIKGSGLDMAKLFKMEMMRSQNNLRVVNE